jgi:hypothetical protein
MMGATGARIKPADAPPAGGTRRRPGAASRSRRHSTAFTMSSTTFLASPNTIIVLSM